MGLFATTTASSTIGDLGLTGVNVTGRDRVGAVVGDNLGDISAVSATGRVKATGDRVGGLIGRMSGGTLDGGSSAGAVSGVDDVGGLVGELAGGSVSDSGSEMSVSGVDDVGGLVGSASSSASISGSHASGDVSASGQYAGGLVGTNAGSITASFATGDVRAASRAGGFVGRNTSNIANSYAHGDAAGDSGHVGGFAGVNAGASADIDDSYSTGAATSTDGSATDVGGFIGSGDGDDSGNVWDTDSSGQATSSGSAVGQTGASLRSSSNDDWDSAIWDFGTSQEYPALKADWNNDGSATWQEFGAQRRPDQPTGIAVQRGPSQGSLTVTWNEPDWDGGSSVTSYEVRYIGASDDRAFSRNWTHENDLQTESGLTFTVTGLGDGATHAVQVRASNTNGPGRWSGTATSTTNISPVFAQTPPVGFSVEENTEADPQTSARRSRPPTPRATR